MFPVRIRRPVRALLLAAMLVAGVPAVHAQADAPASPDGAVNVANYVSCAGGLAIASSPAAAWAALTLCFKVIADEWNRSF